MSWQIRDLSQDLCNGIQTENRQRDTQQGILLDKLNGRRFYIFNDIFNFLYRFAHQWENLQIHTLENDINILCSNKEFELCLILLPNGLYKLKLNCIGEFLFWANSLEKVLVIELRGYCRVRILPYRNSAPWHMHMYTNEVYSLDLHQLPYINRMHYDKSQSGQ